MVVRVCMWKSVCMWKRHGCSGGVIEALGCRKFLMMIRPSDQGV